MARESPMARTVLHWLGWFVSLAGLYLLLSDTTKGPELMAGAIAAAAGATLALALRREGHPGSVGGRRPGPIRGVLPPAAIARAVARIPPDCVVVTKVLWRRLARRRPVRGRFKVVEFGADGAERRAAATLLDSLAPNSYVVGVDVERDLMLVHQLMPSGDPDDADPTRMR